MIIAGIVITPLQVISKDIAGRQWMLITPNWLLWKPIGLLISLETGIVGLDCPARCTGTG